MTRLTLSAADPMILGISHVAIQDFLGIKIMFTNNKYIGSVEAVKKTGSPSILSNVQAKVPGVPAFMTEVQLYLDDFLSLKSSQHKTYEITRATRIDDFMRPIYKPILEQVSLGGQQEVVLHNI